MASRQESEQKNQAGDAELIRRDVETSQAHAANSKSEKKSKAVWKPTT